MDDSVEITVRLPTRLRHRLDAIAQAAERPRAWVIERAVENFLEMESIKQALAEADADDFASEAEVNDVFAKWRSGARNAD